MATFLSASHGDQEVPTVELPRSLWLTLARRSLADRTGAATEFLGIIRVLFSEFLNNVFRFLGDRL